MIQTKKISLILGYWKFDQISYVSFTKGSLAI
jgi:hypothetical protein